MPVEIISNKLDFMRKVTDHLKGMTPDWKIILTDPTTKQPFEAACPYNLADSVYRGRLTFGDEVELEFLALMEAPRQLNPNGGGLANLTQDEEWTLLIQGFGKEDRVHPTDPAYNLLSWVQKRMSMVSEENKNGARGGVYPEVWRFGNTIGEVRYQIPIVRPGQDDVSAAAYFYMPISVGIVTDLTNPFIVQEV